MSINTKIRLTILASSVALAAAASASFAVGPDTTYSPQGGTPNATTGKDLGQVLNPKLVPVDVVPDSGSSSYRPEGGAPDAAIGHETKKAKQMKHVKHKKIAPSDPNSLGVEQQPGAPKY